MGQRVYVLIDSGATHNFIDAQPVHKRGIPMEEFEGFPVLVPGAMTLQCAKYVPELTITMGTYTLTDHFFVVDILDTNFILGVEWLVILGLPLIGELWRWNGLEKRMANNKRSRV